MVVGKGEVLVEQGESKVLELSYMAKREGHVLRVKKTCT